MFYGMPVGILGKTVRYRGHAYTIIGLAPKFVNPILATRRGGSVYRLPTWWAGPRVKIPKSFIGGLTGTKSKS